MTVSIVVAMSDNNVIGRDGTMPWHLPEDLAHFKKVTMGHPMIMGRRTFESIGKPLPGRTTLVVTRSAQWNAAGVVVAHGLYEALDRGLALDDDVSIVGGGQIYAEALKGNVVDRMIVSRVAGNVEGDTVFPTIDLSFWNLTDESEFDGFSVVTYERAQTESRGGPERDSRIKD